MGQRGVHATINKDETTGRFVVHLTLPTLCCTFLRSARCPTGCSGLTAQM